MRWLDNFRLGMLNWAIRSSIVSVMPYGFSSGQNRAWRFADFVRDGYRRNPVVYGCLGKISGGCTAVNLQLAKDGEIIPATKMPKQLKPITTLLKRPNPNQSFSEFKQLWTTQCHLGGISYIRGFGIGMDGERAKTAPELRLIRPDIVTLKDNGAEVTGYTVQYKDGQRQVPAEEILNIKFADPEDEFRGMSPLEACSYAIDSSNAALVFNLKLLKNSGVPAGLLMLKGTKRLTKHDRDEAEETFQRRYSGPDNAGKTVVLDGNSAEYKQLAQNSRDMSWKEGKREALRDICLVLGVPSVLVGDPELRTYSNMESAESDFYVNTIMPLMRHFADELGNWLFPQYGLDEGYSLQLDTSAIPCLQENQTDIVAMLKDADFMKVDEKRERMGLEPVGGDIGEMIYFKLAGSRKPIPADELELDSEERSTRAIDDEPTFDPLSKYPTLETRAAFIAVHDDMREPWNDKYQAAIAKLFSEQVERVIDALGLRSAPGATETRVTADALPADFWQAEVIEYAEKIEPLQTGLVIQFGQAAMDELVEEGVLFNLERPDFKQWLGENLVERATLIDETTADDIQRILTATEGQSNVDVAKALREKFDDMGKGRANTIARTEVCRADTKATLEGYKQAGDSLGMVISSEWITARDGGDRHPSYAGLDGQVAKPDEDFNVGGAMGPGPGLTGDPKEDCN